MMKQKTFALTALQIAVVVSAASATASIFLDSQGKDPRQEMTSSEMPWSTIGLVTDLSNGKADWNCTGTLIGKRLVLTAAHCVINENEDPKKNTLYTEVTFQPNYKNGKALDSSSATDIIVGTMDYLANSGNDWAIIVLKDDLGTKYGIMEIVSNSNLTLPMTVSTAGYGGDFKDGETAGIVSNCQILQEYEDISNGANSQDVYYHSCTGYEGDSGSPIFHLENGKYTIAAIFTDQGIDDDKKPIVTQTYSFSSANVAVMNKALLQAVQAVKLKYE